MTITIRHALGQYDVALGAGLLDELGARLKSVAPCEKAFVLTDENVAPLYLARAMRSLAVAGYDAHSAVLPAGEQTKSLASLSGVYARLCDAGITRSDVVVALGGGVIGDLAGFAAATYLRGVRCAQIPTSLLAQVDSSVGGKTAVDLPQGKNLVGCFSQPVLVLVDTRLTDTLPARVFRDGMGEVLKYGVAFDENLFHAAADCRQGDDMTDIVARCVDWKRAVVEKDERDTGERMLLNLGHTIGHAIEAAQGYAGYTHGEAVAAGMALMARLGETAGLTSPGTVDAIETALRAQRLPATASADLLPAMLDAMRMDKKHLNGALQIVVPNRIGQCRSLSAPPSFFVPLKGFLRAKPLSPGGPEGWNPSGGRDS